MAKLNLESVLDTHKTKIYATTISIDVLKRILITLRENGHINRTNLAGRTGLNYGNCVKYLNLLHLLGWIEMISDDGYFVTITQKGVDLAERLVNQL